MAPVPTSDDRPSSSVHLTSYAEYRDFLASHTERVLDEDGQTVLRVRPDDLHSFLAPDGPAPSGGFLRIRSDNVWTGNDRGRPPRLPTAPPLAHHPNGPEPTRFRCASCGCWNTVSTISITREEGGR